MTIRLKSTGKEETVSRIQWETNNKYRSELWEILDEGDPVLAIQLGPKGEDVEMNLMDRDHAARMINGAPDKFSMVSYQKAIDKKPKITIDPDKINLIQKQKDDFIKKAEAHTAGPLIFPDLENDRVSLDGWLEEKYIQNNKTTVPVVLGAFDIETLSMVINNGSIEDRTMLSKMLQQKQFVFDMNQTLQPAPRPFWRLPRISFTLSWPTLSVWWLVISFFTFCGGFYLARQYEFPVIKLNEYQVIIGIWIASIGATAYVLNLIHSKK